MMTDPTSQNIKPDTKLSATFTVFDLKFNIFMALVLALYVVVMILSIVKGIPYLKRFYQKKSQKLSNITLHEQDNNDYEFSIAMDKEKDVEEKTFSF